MPMNLPAQPSRYDPKLEEDRNRALRAADGENYKQGKDIELAAPANNRRGAWLILRDEVTGTRYRLKIASGVLSITAVP